MSKIVWFFVIFLKLYVDTALSTRRFSYVQIDANNHIVTFDESSSKTTSIRCSNKNQRITINQAFWHAKTEKDRKSYPSCQKPEYLLRQGWQDQTVIIQQKCSNQSMVSDQCDISYKSSSSQVAPIKGSWHICYSCRKLNYGHSKSNLTLAIDFSKTLLRNLLQPPWSSSEKLRPNEALALVKVAEYVAAKISNLMILLQETQEIEIKIDQFLEIHLLVVNTRHTNISTLMFGNGLVTLPIQENFYGGAPTEMISAVMINYFSQSSVTETLKAEHMLTLSLFQANGQKMKVKLRSPVILEFSGVAEKNTICSFYDFDSLNWSNKGCSKNLENSACECNHLTHFGLLLRPPTEDTGTHHAVPLRLITICGCSISAFALILTAGFLIYRGKINDRIRINKHFCINLLIVEILMIFGINQHDENQFNPLCLTLGIFLHWSLLVTFMWSLLAGFQVYLLLVVIFESDTTSRMSKYRYIAYGIPTGILLISVIIDQAAINGETYTSHTQCWMRPNMLFVWSLLVPLSVTVLINMFMLSLAIFRVCELESRPLLILRQSKGLLGLLFILGGTWLIGIANTIYGNLTLTYIFTILNSLQGFFIFIFNVALTDTFRQSMSGFCIWCNEEAGGSGNSNTVSFGR